MINDVKVNEQIKASNISLVTPDDEFIEKISLQEALHQAGEWGLDLVEVSPSDNGKLAICKALDYGKMKYKQGKQKKQKKKETVKEIKFGLYISDNDLEVKNKKVKSLLAKGNKVRYILELKGREMAQAETAMSKITNNLEQFADVAQWSGVKRTGRSFSSLITRL